MSKSVLEWGFTYWQAAFMDALATRSAELFWPLIGLVLIIMLIESVIVAADAFGQSKWSLALRFQFAQRHGSILVDSALSASTRRDEQDFVQSTVEDTRLLSEQRAALSTGALASGVTIALFGFTLFGLLPDFVIGGVRLPAPLLIFTGIWFGASVCLLHVAGGGLHSAESDVAGAEGRLRAAMARLRESAKSAALLAGSVWEARSLSRAVSALSGPVQRSAALRARVQAIGSFIGPSDLMVLVVLSGFYFSGQISFGQLFQAGMAHRGIGLALDWYVKHYADWVRFQAAGSRVAQWEARARQFRRGSSIVRRIGGSRLEVSGLELWSPDGESQWTRKYPDLTFTTVTRLAVRGRSGLGKSALFLAMAGAWPWGCGSIQIPEGTVFVPQKPYFPFGTLIEVLSYPGPVNAEAREKASALLAELQLPNLAKKLDETRDWGATLSGGEASRLGLVRALIAQPRWLFLDEPTANLDAASTEVYWQVLLRQANLSLVLISHSTYDQQLGFLQISLAATDADPWPVDAERSPSAANRRALTNERDFPVPS